MYAVIKTGGKQYKVDKGDVIRVERISGEVGDTVKLEEVLVVGESEEVKIGTPYLEKAEVVAKILRHAKGKKIIVFKKKRRKGYSKKFGHRQEFSEIEIQEINPEKKLKAEKKGKPRVKRARKTETEKVKKKVTKGGENGA